MTNPYIYKALSYAQGLSLLSPNKVAGADGRRVGTRTGNALEFAEYREYKPGDDIRRLDWGVFARSEQLMVRQFNEEVDPRCDIVLDESASMSVPESKGNAAIGLAALLAVAAVNAGFSINLWHAACEWEREQAPESPLEWSDTAFASDTNPGDSAHSFTGRMLPRGIRFAISDFLWTSPPEDFLKRISQGARKVILLRLDFQPQISDADFGPLEIIDSESSDSKEFILDAQALENYNRKHLTHQELWNRVAIRNGADIIDFSPKEIDEDFGVKTLVHNLVLTCKN
ncbi:MAG: DUF58 domain-containing protein [Victivallales bacterium]|nr:DUF58 domain-containing protein [Victivallales bacterium]